MSVGMKSSSGHNQNGGVDKQGEHERHAGINGRELDRLTFAGRRLLVIARLHNRRMKVKIMRHDGCPENPDRDVKHVAIADDFSFGEKTGKHRGDLRFRENDLKKKTAA